MRLIILHTLVLACIACVCMADGREEARKDQGQHQDKQKTPQRYIAKRKNPRWKPSDCGLYTNDAAISVLIADMKVQKKSVQICELGIASDSVFKGYEWATRKKGWMREQMYDYLAEVMGGGHKLFYVGERFVGRQSYDDDGLDRLLQLGGRIFPNFAAFSAHLNETRDDYPKRRLDSMNDTFWRDAKNYRGLALLRDMMYSENMESILRFQKEQPEILILDKPTRPWINMKYNASRMLTREPSLNKFKPNWIAFKTPIPYPINEQAIYERLKADKYVLKPNHESEGKGVIIFPRSDLVMVLNEAGLFESQKDPRIPARRSDLKYSARHPQKSLDKSTFGYYKKNQRQILVGRTFILEAYSASDPLDLGSKGVFDATMRAVFGLVYSNGEYSYKLIDAYWRLPPKPIGSQTRLEVTAAEHIEHENNAHKSLYGVSNVALVDGSWKESVVSIMSAPDAFPLLFHEALEYCEERRHRAPWPANATTYHEIGNLRAETHRADSGEL
jgi:hypothetical protein